MKLVLALSALCLMVSPALSKNLGSITVKDYGEVFLCGPDWAASNIAVHDNGFTINGNARLYFCSSDTDDWSPDMYWQTNLLDKHFTYTLDLSKVGCQCNAAAYFIDMPGNNAGSGDYYCDGNMGNGIWCPEYDVLEANKYTIATTLHTCKGDGNGNWDSCDRSGCQVNAYYVDPTIMCPDESCQVNTNNPFTISHFQNSEVANTKLSQDGSDANWNMCNDGGYLSTMASSYSDMVFCASLWGGGGIDMGWLDGMTGCSGECNIDASSVSFTNFALKDANPPATTTTTTTTTTEKSTEKK